MRRHIASRVCWRSPSSPSARPAAAQSPARRRPRRRPGRRRRGPAPPKDFVLPKPQRFTLHNGLPVTMVPFGTVPKVRVQLVVRSGQRRTRTPTRSGSPTRPARCCRKAPTALHRRCPRARAGERWVASSPSRSAPIAPTSTTEVLSERGPQAVRLLADVVQRPRLPESELPRVKANLARTLAIQKSTPQSIAHEKFQALMYGDHPVRPPLPDRGDARRATRSNTCGVSTRRTSGRRRARLYVAGVFDPAAMEATIREAFGCVDGRRRDRSAGCRRSAGARLRADRSIGRAAVHHPARRARPGSVEQGLDRARGGRLAARRLVRVAHHLATSASRRATPTRPSARSTRTRRTRTGSSRPTSPPTSPARR